MLRLVWAKSSLDPERVQKPVSLSFFSTEVKKRCFSGQPN
jgi:hypothetical protein